MPAVLNVEEKRNDKYLLTYLLLIISQTKLSLLNIWFYLGYAIVAVAIIIGMWLVINYPIAYGQENTSTSNEAPPAVIPTPSATPVQTSPSPNFEYLPQKAYVQAYKPEIGVPAGQQPLIAVPQVVPVQQQQPIQQETNNIIDSLGGWTGITALAAAAGVYLKTRVLNKVVKENSTQIAKGADVDQSLANQVYENMPDKGNSIIDKPEIRLETLSKNKEEATETAAKA